MWREAVLYDALLALQGMDGLDLQSDYLVAQHVACLGKAGEEI